MGLTKFLFGGFIKLALVVANLIMIVLGFSLVRAIYSSSLGIWQKIVFIVIYSTLYFVFKFITKKPEKKNE